MDASSPVMPSVRTVLVVGAGTMGGGIAQVAAESGIDVILCDADERNLQRGHQAIIGRWERAITSGRRTDDEVAAFQIRLHPGNLSQAADVDVIIEAIYENVAAKRELLAELASIAKPDALIASNTSSISITALGRATGRPAQFIGLHFFNPVPVLPLVEVVRGLESAEETVARGLAFARQLGKSPVLVNDAPGFVANRLLVPMINEAIFALQDGVATADAIDDVMKLGMSHPMGPLALADLIGLDVCLDIMETLHRDFGDDKYRPAPLLRRMVASGRLGRKSGEGFHTYGQN